MFFLWHNRDRTIARGEDDMLLEFSCSNYKSMMNTIVLSYLADSKEYKVLPSALVYGPNGSGKSNLLDAINTMTSFILHSIENPLGEDLASYSHKLLGDEIPTVFTMQFTRQTVRYSYGFSIKNHKIDEEYLYYFPNEKQITIFERKGMNIIPGQTYTTKFSLSLDALKENRLFLSCAANFTNIHEIIEAFLFFKEDIVIYNKDPKWMDEAIAFIQKSKANKQALLDAFHSCDIQLKDIKATIQSVSIPNGMQFNQQSKMNVYHVTIVYDAFTVDLLEESKGFKMLFTMLCVILDCLKHEKLFICDDFDSCLHEVIVGRLLTLFQQSKAQCLCTMQHTGSLDTNLVRHDQIWFTQLDEKRSTDLFSLIEIKHVKDTDNIRKQYLLGKYGAIPNLYPKR